MAEAAESVCAGWPEDTEIDLDAQCRTLTLRALGRSVLGLDLDERSDAIAEPLRVATSYAVRRALRPLRAPEWLPTPSRRRARAAAGAIRALADEILQACRADPGREAPLVHALIAATDPETGQALSDKEIRDEMIIFLFAGHDTTATTLTYALWALGRHPEYQARVAAEVAELPDRHLTPDDVARLGFTVRVLQEALRLCPPGPTGTRMATRDVEVAGYRVEAGTMLAFGRMAVQTDPSLWDAPLRFDPDRFDPAAPVIATGGSTYRSGAGRARASGTTLRCWRLRSRWQPSFAASKSSPCPTISRWPCPSPWSRRRRSGPW